MGIFSIKLFAVNTNDSVLKKIDEAECSLILHREIAGIFSFLCASDCFISGTLIEIFSIHE